MEKEFLTLKRQTVVDIANAIRSKTNSNKAIRIEDLDDAIEEIESGGASGGGSAMLERPGIQPVPREGYIEKIKFNTDLSKDEVVSIVDRLDALKVPSGEEWYEYRYFILCSPVNEQGVPDYYVIILKTQNGPGVPSYGIYLQVADESHTLFDMFEEKWCIDEEVVINNIVCPEVDFGDGSVMTFGAQNDLLVDLVYIEGEPISKELTGTYAATDLEITENGTIDILPMIDNKEIPVSVEVNVSMPKIEGELIGNGVVEYQSPAKEKIYINTSLSKEEVIERIKDLTYTNTSYSWLVSPCYVVYLMMTTRANRPGMTFLGNSLYIQKTEGQNFEYRICIGNIDLSSSLEYGKEIFNSTDGWMNVDVFLNEDGSIKNEFLTGTLPVLEENNTGNGWNINSDMTVSELNYALIYTENDKLTDLIYVKQSSPITKELTGTYDGIELEVTENTIIDIAAMIDEGKLPLTIKVNVPQPQVYDGSVTVSPYGGGES